MSDIEELRPARPDPGEDRPAYLPRIPWKWIAGLTLLAAVSIGTCQLRHRQEMTATRAAVMDAYRNQLGPHVDRYRELKAKVVAHTLAAAEKAPEPYVDPRLKLDALGSDVGLYMRLLAADATDPEELGRRALALPPDAIARCLGIAPLSAAEMLVRGSFLEERFIQQADDAETVLKLRVVAEELKQRSQRDLPLVVKALEARWFMLVLQQGETRRTAPVDVYLWDLRGDKLLLSRRVQSEGALVAARIAVQGVKPGAYPSGAQTGAAQDCAIASKLRGLVGSQSAPAFESDPPRPKEALGNAKPGAQNIDSAKPASSPAPGPGDAP